MGLLGSIQTHPINPSSEALGLKPIPIQLYPKDENGPTHYAPQSSKLGVLKKEMGQVLFLFLSIINRKWPNKFVSPSYACLSLQ